MWVGASRREIDDFPSVARRRAGQSLRLVQEGLQPEDWKPMGSVGLGVRELRVRQTEGGVVQYRVIYVARFREAVYVLHAFEKKARATPAHHVEVARARYRAMLRERRANS